MQKTITRRAAMGAIATLPAIGGATAALAAPGAIEAPELLQAVEAFHAALAERKAAEDALDWIADEWRHHWPLAPEEITVPRAFGWEEKEKDIAGRKLIRRTRMTAPRIVAAARC